jgi:hypothetical protein
MGHIRAYTFVYVYACICLYISPFSGVRIKKQCLYKFVYFFQIRTYIEGLYKHPKKYTYTNVYARISLVYRLYIACIRTYIANIRTYTNIYDGYTYDIRTYTYAYVYARIRTYTRTYIIWKYVRILPEYTRNQKSVSAIYVRKWHKFEKAVYILPNGGYSRWDRTAATHSSVAAASSRRKSAQGVP